MKKRLRTGRSVIVVAAAWNIVDALLHVAIDEIDPLRMAGNAVVLVATALAYRPGVAGAIVAAVAAAIVVALNVAFFIDKGEVPVAALVLVTVSLVLLAIAVWSFRAEEHEAGTTVAAADACWSCPTLKNAAAYRSVQMGGATTSTKPVTVNEAGTRQPGDGPGSRR